jgi:Flp pilus assembly protein TadB
VIMYVLAAGLLAGGLLMVYGVWPWAALVFAVTGFVGLGYLVGLSERRDAERRNHVR